METENIEVTVEANQLTTVTPVSKYLAMILFILLPFIGGWVGYTYAPEKIVEVEKVISKTVPATQPEVDVIEETSTTTISSEKSSNSNVAPITKKETTTSLAAPTSGAAPLEVTFSLPVTDSSDESGIYYTIVFGDGDAAGFSKTDYPKLTHTYNKAGKYAVVITRRTECGSWECLGESSEFSKTLITVQ